MTLTATQLATLKASLAANSATVIIGGTVFAINSADVLIPGGPVASEEAAKKVSDWYNALASPNYWCWRTAVEKKEIVEKISQDGTTFIWAGNGFITRSVGELECWKQLFNSALICNPSLPNVRQAFSDVFSGAGNAATNRAHLLVVGRHKANVGGKLLAVVATGPGNDGISGNRGNVSNPDAPGLDVAGNAVVTLSAQDIKDAWVS